MCCQAPQTQPDSIRNNASQLCDGSRSAIKWPLIVQYQLGLNLNHFWVSWHYPALLSGISNGHPGVQDGPGTPNLKFLASSPPPHTRTAALATTTVRRRWRWSSRPRPFTSAGGDRWEGRSKRFGGGWRPSLEMCLFYLMFVMFRNVDALHCCTKKMHRSDGTRELIKCYFFVFSI